MKKISFLAELYQQGKLQLVEPSEDICSSYLEKSSSHLESAGILLKAGKLEESVSMAYYGMYHCLLALLFRCGIKSENHAASIILLKELFQQKSLAEEISFGKKERVDKQYYLDFNLSASEAKEMLKKSENFIVKCKLLINALNKEKIKALSGELRLVLK